MDEDTDKAPGALGILIVLCSISSVISWLFFEGVIWVYQYLTVFFS